MKYKIGLKLWSTNLNYIDEAVKLYEQGLYSYIELFSVPGSFGEYINHWKKVDIPVIIHAAHYSQGMNLSQKECWKSNEKLAAEAKNFADGLNADIIIFHSGVGGTLEETARQLKLVDDKRAVIENKPYYGLNDEDCVGYSPENIQYIMGYTGLRFCLDLGHAICAANALKTDPIEFNKEFIKLKPVLYHLTDGDFKSVYDRHFHYGEGDFPLSELFGLIPEGQMITNEAKKSSQDNLDDFVADVNFIKAL